MVQTVLNFSIESSDEKLTPSSKTILLEKFLRQLNLKDV